MWLSSATTVRATYQIQFRLQEIFSASACGEVVHHLDRESARPLRVNRLVRLLAGARRNHTNIISTAPQSQLDTVLVF